ncbi:flavodoxin [Candidatus Methylospira mobilis]|uniref:Flavodoxin n=1 Tax=Candidatus Methylospira mobilis TaxID=1808979 RepID=A0A5Q0BMP7_9GAMM|nr:flavodoxin [Candidatus Methylospira mobilis]QFY44422.1 flavodoxin [Candidatus Methylospira mobilis]
MSKIGIFFGTDTGSTRLVAKRIYSRLGESLADKPKNINRTRPDELLQYEALILGTPSYGLGELPGLSTGCQESNWQEFAPYLDGADLSGKRVALFGLGHQERYADRFASSLIHLYRLFYGQGADIVGSWSTDGYQFQHSHAIIDNRFVGLVLDQRGQPGLTDSRVDLWLTQVMPLLLPSVGAGWRPS